MPYINQVYKSTFQHLIDHFDNFNEISTFTEGELNYLITKLLLSTHPKSYKNYNTLIGVLECCKLEFYRRAVTMYEQKKIVENGDVYNDYIK